jgi:hypothetical protein
MKKIKINENKLIAVLGTVMISPSVINYLYDGSIYAYGSDWNLGIKQTEIFSRRKVIRLIRKFNKNYELESRFNLNYWVRKKNV